MPVSAAPAAAQDLVRGRLLQFNDNGAWSWFEDERAIVDPSMGMILVGSCSDESGVGGAARSGDIDLAWLDVSTGRFGQFELRDRLQDDDHNSPALLLRPDGRYLAMYGTHGSSTFSWWRFSDPGDPSSWSGEGGYSNAGGATYSNLHHIPDPSGASAGTTYNFVRARNFDPNVMQSTNLGTSWTGGGKLLTEGGGGDRPYLKYSSDGVRIHLTTTERHPRNYQNSIYHGYVEGGAVHDSFGNVLDASVSDLTAAAPANLTRVFQNGTSFGGTVMRRAWTVDVDAGASTGGVVRTLFTARANDSSSDHRLFHGRFDGTAWDVNEVCRMGGFLYGAEDDYTGLAALDPNDPARIFVSTDIDPRTGASTAHYEIYEGRTQDGGQSFTFTAITEDSTVDNLRPIVPSWDDERTALLWLRGTYTTYVNYDLAVVGIVEAPELPFDAAIYYDATPQNTTRANGAPVAATGPSGGVGSNDGQWHRRSGFGNGGEVWASSESGAENAPTLRTRLTGLTPGEHDVYVAFWTNPNQAWSIRAGFASDQLRHLEKQSAQAVTSEHMNGGVVSSGPTVRMYSAWLGRAVVDASGELDVYVDDIASGQSPETRTWYDGIATAEVVCAPSVRFCDALPNSSGSSAHIDRVGSCSMARNDLGLIVNSGPTSAWSVLVYGRGRASVPLADGRLCLASDFGRIGPQQLDIFGQVTVGVDLGPSTALGAAISPGETWGFQLWFRDSTPGGANLSDALELTFSN